MPQNSRYIGMAFSYDGLEWSVYSNVIARGAKAVREECQFGTELCSDEISGPFRPRTPTPRQSIAQWRKSG